MVNAAHPAPGSPPYAQQLAAREEAPQTWVWEEEPRVVAAVGRGSRGVRRGCESTGPELQIALGAGDGRECPDRGWVKMTIAAAVVESGGGMVYLQDSRG